MTVAKVKEEIVRFLRADKPSVVCLAGAWGVGKTHLWRETLKHTAPHSSVSRYSYVSLFGLNSLADVKQAIFENSVKTADRASGATIEGLRSFVDSAEGFARKGSWLGSALASQQFSALSRAFFLTVRNQVVCFDDLERHGSGLAVGDVLGLASFLKEERNCRVVIILNDEMLGEARGEFERYLEKVSDRLVRLAPTPKEAADIALLGEAQNARLLAENAVKLGISNIRTIRRAWEFVERVEPIVAGFREEVTSQVVQTLALVTWCVLEPEAAPSPKFLSEKRNLDVFGSREADEINPDEARWNALLDSFSKSWHMDDLDMTLLRGVQSGLFDEDSIRRFAQAIHDELERGGLRQRWRDVWFEYASSLKGDEGEVLERFRQAFGETLSILTPLDVNGIIGLFKTFDRADEARAMVHDYVDAVQERDFRFFDLSEHHFFSDPPDPDLQAAFDALYARKKPPRAVEDALILIGKGQGWNFEDEEVLWKATEEELFGLLNEAEGQRFTQIMSGATHWWKVGNAPPEMAEFNRKVRSVLTRIAGLSRLNATRLQRFGIRPADEAEGDVQPA